MQMTYWLICSICVGLTLFRLSLAKKPNIIFILTDDQDTVIGGQTPIAKTRALIGDAGIVFKNAFVTTPLCCPSRASILTGRYVHNHGAINNSYEGGCNSERWKEKVEPKAFAPFLKDLGYQTLFAGKYLNQYGMKFAGGVEHIPPGWNDWYGLAGNSRYYQYIVSNNGVAEKHHGDNYTQDYFTDRIHDRAVQLLQKQTSSAPFFMMLSVPACHAPFSPAPQYAERFSDVQPPRDGSYNTKQMDKHWLMRQVINPMDSFSTDFIERTYRNRWRTLLSVDDLVEDIVDLLGTKGWLDNTYIFFTSDNGFHMGQFSLPVDKRQLYEFDIRVPFMVRGPGIRAGQVREEIILNIDLAPTFIDLAGGQPPEIMDGVSMKEILRTSQAKVVSSREEFMLEHTGEFKDTPHCPFWNGQLMMMCFPSCVCEDSHNNTYICVRRMTAHHNDIYCEFLDDESFVEVYNLNEDPHQLRNIANQLSSSETRDFKKRLGKLSQCSGQSCRT